MTLRELATTETTALVDRLVEAMTAELTATTERLQADADAALEKVRQELADAVAAAARTETARQEAETARETEAGRRVALQRDLDEARRTIDATLAEAAATVEALRVETSEKIKALTAAAEKQRAEADETIAALRTSAAEQQAEADEKIATLATASARQQAQADETIAALRTSAAEQRAEADEKIAALTTASARQQAEAGEKIEALMATAAKLQAGAKDTIDAITATAARQQAEAKEKIEAVLANAAAMKAEANAKIEALNAAAARQQAETHQKIDALTAASAKAHAEATGKIEALTRDRDQLTASLADAHKHIEAAQADKDAVSAELQRTEAARARLARTLRDQVLQLASLPMDRLRTGFYRLTTAPSVTEALTALVETLGSEFSRAALFQVTGNRLQGVHQVGFDFESDISKVIVPLTRESPLTEAVRSGRVQGLTASELTASSRTLFGGTPGFVLVLPVAICGEIAAVVYADDSEDPEAEYSTPERRVKFAEVLLWHAVPLLTRLSIEENTRAELREYAIQLFTDLERAYAADKTTAPTSEKLRGHLEHNLEYARQMFAQQAEACGRHGSSLFDEQLEALIRSQGATPFVRDLAAVAHIPAVKPASKARKHS